MNGEPITTYLVKIFTAQATEETPYQDLLEATRVYGLIDDAAHSEQGSLVLQAYLYAVTNGKRVMLRTFDLAYDEYLESISGEPYKCIYCGQRNRSDDSIGFYCYAGPRGEHHYEMVDGDE